ncbi:nucleoside hydrolase [Leptolyngbya sp. FACHB-321]|uniref:nucleoside hydrolase n=1 Tax=Leptolyngbya sp. FACHB-321 TaxID=2692807 RepID=UPI0016826A3B|nr:nucleoside hydrolase [Leptolyngbya sp. FACHB-321]MBD2035642.1 nucleoside hydrolase [Leptolyngbya sp. FACHB-321]
MAAKPIIIDCDPGADDAIALFLALAFPEKLDVLGITTVAGNVPLHLTQKNARCLCELAGRADLPVYAGCPRPLLRPLITAEDVHGRTGLDGIHLPEPTMPLQEQHAVDFLIDTVMRSTGNITLATLGPLTNLAVAIVKQPEICQRLQEVVMMGGAATQGNITPSAEFNVYVDPHAAQVVVTAGIPLTIVSLDVTHQAIATPERLSTIEAINSPISAAAIGLLNHYGAYDMQRYGFPGPPLHDPCVIAYLLQPDLFTRRRAYVAIETTSELTMGRTVIDQWHVTNQPANATVIESIEAEGFYQLLTQAIDRFKEHGS